MTEFFIHLSILLLVAVILGFIAKLLRQPPILAYLATGILLGPNVLNLIETSQPLALFSQLGVAFLLFIVGISLDPRRIKDIGKISLVTGIGQVIFTAFIGFFISKALGFSTIASVYIGVALTFSSTIIIVKLLTDKNDIDSLYGRISVGILIIQDFIAILALVLISSFQQEIPLGTTLLFSLAKAAGLLLLIWLGYNFLLRPALAKLFSTEQELVFLAAIAWCFIAASISTKLGFSLEIGAFLAGFSLAPSEFGATITAKIKPLRDFFIALFFINLGIGMSFTLINQLLLPIIIFTLFIIVGNPLIVFFLMVLFGYRSRTSFLTGLTVAQISEFSLILAAFGFTLGHLSQEAVVLITTVGIITITASTYLITYGNTLYTFFQRPLKLFERRHLKEITALPKAKTYSILLFGCHRIGSTLTDSLPKNDLLVIDYNPYTIADLKRKKIDSLYADIQDQEVMRSLTSLKPRFVLSTIPDAKNNKLLISTFKTLHPKPVIILIARTALDSLELHRLGADLVLFPEYLAGRHLAELLSAPNKKAIKKLGRAYRLKLLAELKKNHLFA